MDIQYVYDSNKGIRVHRAGCADVAKDARAARRRYDGINPTEVADATVRRVVEDFYADMIFTNDQDPWTDFAGEVTVLPCAAGLPEDGEA